MVILEHEHDIVEALFVGLFGITKATKMTPQLESDERIVLLGSREKIKHNE